jgi:hypothetical protein
MTAKTAAATHRVFEAIQGLWPVTFANVREADPAGLLDIFEGSDSTRDRYIEVTAAVTETQMAGHLWANDMSGFDTDHTDECYFSAGSMGCRCKERQYADNQQWGQDLWEAIQQRIDRLND